jgi:cold-inducible RNA-binding protein
MGTRIYVGNLPYEFEEEELRRLFEADGRSVSEISVVMDRDTGRPRGFAFVEMANANDARAAITALNGREFGGRALTVNEARERTGDRGGSQQRRRW